MVLMMRSGASSTVTGAIRSVMSAFAGFLRRRQHLGPRQPSHCAEAAEFDEVASFHGR